VSGDRVDLYRFKVTRDSAVHFVAFFASRGGSVACLGFGWIWDGLDDAKHRWWYFKDMGISFGEARESSISRLVVWFLVLLFLSPDYRLLLLCYLTIAIVVSSTTLVSKQHIQHVQHARRLPHRRPPGPGRRPELDQLCPCCRFDRSLSRRLRDWRCQLPGRVRQRTCPERFSDRGDQQLLEERMLPGRLWRGGHQEVRRVPCVLRTGLLLH